MATRSTLHLTVSSNGLERRLVFEFDGDAWKVIRNIPAAAGSMTKLVSGDAYSDDTVVGDTGLLAPCVMHLERRDGARTLLFAQEAVLVAEDFKVEARSTESLDGTTTIDYTVLRPKVAKRKRGEEPVLMTGYGAFGVSLPMEHLAVYMGGISLVPWLQEGGLLVIPAVRGGGERGPALTDMLRFPHMGMGATWTGEYGDPEDPAAAAVLRSYSPFHNVRGGSGLPPFLVSVSTRDDRVGAGHARKMVARLKDSGAEAYLVEEEDGGHGVSDPFKKAKSMASRVSFWMHHLMR